MEEGVPSLLMASYWSGYCVGSGCWHIDARGSTSSSDALRDQW